MTCNTVFDVLGRLWVAGVLAIVVLLLVGAILDGYRHQRAKWEARRCGRSVVQTYRLRALR